MEDSGYGGVDEPRGVREPLLHAPWTIVTLCLGLVALYVIQTLALSDAQQQGLALSAAGLKAGRWWTLLTSLFLHGSWPHVLINSVAALAYGPPVARLFGTHARGASVFAAFYLVCGVLGGLGFVALNLHDAEGAVGASGAISGLLGAASRIIQGRGRIGRMLGSTVLWMALVWTAANWFLAKFGLTPGAGNMQVAWQAHVVGYAAGVLLIGPFARLAGAGDGAFTD